MKVIKLTDQEINALKGIMDAGVKQLGLEAATAAAIILQKLDSAVEEEPKPAKKK